MKAIVHEEYGPPEGLEVREIERPAPAPGEVLVRVRAASVNPADWHLLRGEPYIARLSFGLPRPKRVVLGSDLAGTVQALGADVTAFEVGDEVFGCSFMRGFGAFGEYVAAPVNVLERKPAELSFEQAAALPLAALTALQGLRDHGRVSSGQSVLIVGATGGVGTFAVQIAKWMGAQVTAVCSTANVERARALGADEVVDYTREDFTRTGRRYDLIFQLAGEHSPSQCRRALTDDGTLIQSSGDSQGRWIGPIGRVIKARALSPFVSQRLTSFTMSPSRDDLRALVDLIETGALRPEIERTFSLEDIPEAIARSQEGHVRGKLVVDLNAS